MSEYYALLRSPYWQRKRLEVLERFDFQCCECENNEDQLHVHHCWYEKGLKPWEYPDGCYLVFCDECHKEWHDMKLEIDKSLASPSIVLDWKHQVINHSALWSPLANCGNLICEQGFDEINNIHFRYMDDFKKDLYQLISDYKGKPCPIM